MTTLHLEDIERERPKSVDLPAPTAWPFVMAFGVSLLAAGLVTTLSVSLTGAVLALAAAVGWFRDVFPHEKHETVPVVGLTETDLPVSLRERVARIDIARGPHRARLPLEIHPVSAGIKGGLAGSVAMAVLAVLYGVVNEGSVWYPINLLAAAASAKLAALPTEGLRAFHADGFALACAIHLLTSPHGRHPLRRDAADVPAPADPARRRRRAPAVDGPAARHARADQPGSQRPRALALVRRHADRFRRRRRARWSTRTAKVRTLQYEPFAVRAGVETPGLRDDEEPRP